MARQNAMDAQVAEYKKQIMAQQQARLGLATRAQDLNEYKVPNDIRLRGMTAQNAANQVDLSNRKFADDTGPGRAFKQLSSIASKTKDPQAAADIYNQADPMQVQTEMSQRAVRESNRKAGQDATARENAHTQALQTRKDAGLGAGSGFNAQAHLEDALRRIEAGRAAAKAHFLQNNNYDPALAGQIDQYFNQAAEKIRGTGPVQQTPLYKRMTELTQQGMSLQQAHDQAVSEGLQ